MLEKNQGQIKENVDFLQSQEWRKFQEAAGKSTFHLNLPHPGPLLEGEGDFGFWANIIEHKLPIAGKYFYIPRGPVIKIPNNKSQISNNTKIKNSNIKTFFSEIIKLAKENKAGWIRIEPCDSQILDLIRDNWRVVKAPHDMQPKEVFVIDIKKSEEELLNDMKQKTRYNIKLAEKKGVKVVTSNKITGNSDCVEEFLKLIRQTEKRKGINFHEDEYYRKMIETIPENMLKLYCAEYDGKIIAANLVIFYGKTATYLHGATCDEYRNVMAPYLLQWQAIKDAKKAGYEYYDFGGVRTDKLTSNKDWSGITKFKLGFSQSAKPIEFSGSWDIIISPARYWSYRVLQRIK